MNFLYVHIKNSIFDLAATILELGHRLSVVDNVIMDPNKPEESHRPHIIHSIETVRPDYIISYLFVPMVSEIALSYGIPYISWTYDSPLTALFSKELENDNNYIFVFDKTEYRRLIERHNQNASDSRSPGEASLGPKIFYLPMAACLSRIGSIDLKEEEIAQFSNDISFIGSLYQKNTYNESAPYLDELTQLELKYYLLTNLRNWEKAKPWPALSQHATNNILTTFNAAAWNTTTLPDANYFGLLFLTRKLAEVDRVTILNALAEHYKVDLYTDDTDNPSLVGVNCHGRVDYHTDMSKIFYCSKINLNITLPSIETGIPQRVFDIMGCGGFVMTNYQEELDDLFTIGSDLEAFKNTDELLEKAAFYLSHEEARQRIAINGYKTIRAGHSYTHRVQEMLRLVQEV